MARIKAVDGVLVEMDPGEIAAEDALRSASFPELSPRQLRLVMLNIGVTAAMIIAEIDKIADPVDRETAMIEWEYATNYEREHSLVTQLASAFSILEDQLDTLWLAAADL